MADDLLERILQEVRERKEAARAAYDESRRLEAALDALGPPSPGRGSAGGETGQTEDMPETSEPGRAEPQTAFGSTTPGGDTPDQGGEDPGRTAEESAGPTEGTPEDLKPGAGPGVDPDEGADAGDHGRETSP